MGGYISDAYRPTFSVKDANDLPNKVQSHFMQNIFMCLVINQLNAQNLVL